MSYSKIRRKAENEIVGSVINDLTSEGYDILIEDSGIECMINAYDFDENAQKVDQGFVKLIWGNVSSVINDYSPKLEQTIKLSLDLAKSYED